jgi:hypothetical protein
MSKIGVKLIKRELKRRIIKRTQYNDDMLAVSILMEYNTNIYIKLPEMRLRVRVGE